MILITAIIKAILIRTSNDNDDGNNDDNNKKMIIVLKTVIKNDSEKGRGKKGKLHKISKLQAQDVVCQNRNMSKLVQTGV